MIERRDARALTAGCRVGEHHIDVRAFDVIGWGGSDRLTRMATQWLTRRFDATTRAFVRAMEADG